MVLLHIVALTFKPECTEEQISQHFEEVSQYDTNTKEGHTLRRTEKGGNVRQGEREKEQC